MKIHIVSSTTRLIRLAVWGLIFASIVTVGLVVARPVDAQQTNGTLITVYDRGVQTTFVSSAPTLAEAFIDAGISIEPKDSVEPSLSEELVAPEYNVNIYRARPVLVVDGLTRKLIVSPYQSATRIVEDAGLRLESEDTATVSRSSNILRDGAGLLLTIDRATTLQLDFYGSSSLIRTQAETVEGLLREKGIVLDAESRLSLPTQSPIQEGMSLRIWREGTQTITTNEPIAFKTDYIQDADRPTTYKEVQTPGIAGSRTVTYSIEIQNGLEVSRTEIATITTLEPVTQVEIIGTKQDTIPYTGGGTKSEWLAASNIPTESWGYADFMVTKESGWNPNAVNSSSGACGLAQALPCSKLGPEWNNPVVALNWMNGYVAGRYYDGSPYAKGVCTGITSNWQCAYAYWKVYKWY